MMPVGPDGPGPPSFRDPPGEVLTGLRGQSVQSCWLQAASLGPELPPVAGSGEGEQDMVQALVPEPAWCPVSAGTRLIFHPKGRGRCPLQSAASSPPRPGP